MSAIFGRDRVTIIAAGRVVADGTIDQLRARRGQRRIGVGLEGPSPDWAAIAGVTAVTDEPSSPIIHSRPIVGVEKRVRTMAGMPAIMKTVVPTMPTERLSINARSTK